MRKSVSPIYRKLIKMGESPEKAIQRISDGFAVTPEDIRKIISGDR